MSVTIEADGSISAFPADVRFIPATKAGNPVKRTVIFLSYGAWALTA
jgi:hypothetical protein